MATENYKYELNSWIPFFVHQILFEVSFNYIQINDQILPIKGFFGDRGQWLKQGLTKDFAANLKTKGISFHHLRILH